MTVDTSIDPHLLDWIRQMGLDTVEGAFAFSAGGDLDKPGLGHRRRTRIECTDGAGRRWELYLKRYGEPPRRLRWKRKLLGRAGRCEARTEFENIRTVRQAGVPTMRELAWGAQRDALGVRRSYLLVDSVPGDAIERVGDSFLVRYAHEGEMIEQLCERLVSLVRGLHEAGLVHRDLYASHVFLHEHDGRVELNLIDLARVFQPRWRRFRWRVKDLAQLKYSMPWQWVRDHWAPFLRAYLRNPGANEIERWDRAVERKRQWIDRRAQRKLREAAERAES